MRFFDPHVHMISRTTDCGVAPSVSWLLRDSQGNEIVRGTQPVNAVGGQLGMQNDEQTAALDGQDVIETINRADELADEGRRNRDPAKLDEALRLRPDDWSYNSSRAVLALEQGDLAGYDKYDARAFETSFRSGDTQASHQAGISMANQRFDEMRELERKLTAERGPGFSSAEQCDKLYRELDFLLVYRQVDAATRRAQRDAFLARRAACV